MPDPKQPLMWNLQQAMEAWRRSLKYSHPSVDETRRRTDYVKRWLRVLEAAMNRDLR